MPNMESVFLMIQKLWPRVKFFCHRVTDRVTERTNTRGHKNINNHCVIRKGFICKVYIPRYYYPLPIIRQFYGLTNRPITRYPESHSRDLPITHALSSLLTILITANGPLIAVCQYTYTSFQYCIEPRP